MPTIRRKSSNAPAGHATAATSGSLSAEQMTAARSGSLSAEQMFQE
jgi:hypothetical protein